MIKSCTKVELLGISIDMKLTFDRHVSEICRKAAGELNALTLWIPRVLEPHRIPRGGGRGRADPLLLFHNSLDQET